MKQKKKAQAAMEFLLTYGWALLVVLAVIGVILAFIDWDSFVPQKCTISNDFRCDSHFLEVSELSTPRLQLIFYNNFQYKLEIEDIRIEDPKGVFGCSGTVEAYNDASLEIESKEKKTFHLFCDEQGTIDLELGDVLDGTLIIKYKIDTTGSEHELKGYIRTRAG